MCFCQHLAVSFGTGQKAVTLLAGNVTTGLFVRDRQVYDLRAIHTDQFSGTSSRCQSTCTSKLVCLSCHWYQSVLIQRMFYSSAGNWHQKLAPATGTRKLVSVYGPLSHPCAYWLEIAISFGPMLVSSIRRPIPVFTAKCAIAVTTTTTIIFITNECRYSAVS